MAVATAFPFRAVLFISLHRCDKVLSMPNLSAEKRIAIGSHLNTLRNQGVLPAVLYGEGVASTPLSVPTREFEKVFREAGETSLVTLKVGDTSYNVLIHDIAVDPLTLKPIHADFYAVRMDKPIEANVPLIFTGTSPAVEQEGGILVKVMHELEVRALPQDLPHEIVVDIEGLMKIGDKLQVKNLVLPAGVVAKAPVEEVVALVEPPRSEAELEVPEKVEEAAPAEVKTEREIKAEREAEAAATADTEQ